MKRVVALFMLLCLTTPAAIRAQGAFTWTPRPAWTPANLTAVSFYWEDEGWIAGASGTVLYSGDTGVSWSPVDVGTTANLTSIGFFASYCGGVVGENGTVITTSDGGNSWHHQALGTGTLNSICYVSEDSAWIAGTDGIYRTVDTGLTWVKQYSTTAGQKILCVSMVDYRVGYASGTGGLILRTANGGKTWTQTAGISTTDDVIAISMWSNVEGMALTGNQIYGTSDGGGTWIGIPALQYLTSCCWNDVYIMASGRGGTVESSLDAATWDLERTYTSQNLNCITTDYENYQNFWAVGDNGTIIGTREYSGDGVATSALTAAQAIQLYPNPASGEITLSQLPTDAEWISIRDVLGQEVIRQRVDAASTTVPVAGLANGRYTCVVQRSNGMSSVPFVVNR